MTRLTTHTRALSLRNLVSGYECGRVCPAGVGPGSPSRDAANWLLSQFSLSVETWQRYGWLRIVFPGARLFRAPIWCPSGGWRHAKVPCVCFGVPAWVCFLPIHSGHQVRWTYHPGSHRISHPPYFCGACLNFSREKDSAIPFPRRP